MAYSDPLVFPPNTQPSAWESSTIPAPPTTPSTSTTAPKMETTGPPNAPIRSSPPEPESATTWSTGQETAAPEPGSCTKSFQRVQREMRKTMRPNHNPAGEVFAAGTGPCLSPSPSRSTPTCRSTYSLSLRSAQPEAADDDDGLLAQMLALGAARTAFITTTTAAAAAAEHKLGMPVSVWVSDHPYPESDQDPRNPHHRRAAAAKLAAKTAETGRGPRQGPRQERKMFPPTIPGAERYRGSGGGGGGTGGRSGRGGGSGNNAMNKFSGQVAARLVVGGVCGYWRLVCPVFDGHSGLRRRIEGGRATCGDWAVCVLAVVFVFLAAAAGVWTVRGFVWVARVGGAVGRRVLIVAGL
ncbi:hypothetical protein VTK56DRAFT_3220 [Thermocarpiscus australiensis]